MFLSFEATVLKVFTKKRRSLLRARRHPDAFLFSGCRWSSSEKSNRRHLDFSRVYLSKYLYVSSCIYCTYAAGPACGPGCMCVSIDTQSVRVFLQPYLYNHTRIYMFTCMNIYVCIYACVGGAHVVCMCGCMWVFVVGRLFECLKRLIGPRERSFLLREEKEEEERASLHWHGVHVCLSTRAPSIFALIRFFFFLFLSSRLLFGEDLLHLGLSLAQLHTYPI